MPIPTPFHSRTAALCTSLAFKDWAGYYAVCSFDTHHEREYFALRHAAAMIDVTPLFKCDVHGPDAAAFLSRIMVRNIEKLKLHRVAYLCWCDDDGKTIDDGTVCHLDEDYFRVTSNVPGLHWLARHARGVDVTIEDTTAALAVLSVQGPNARAVVSSASNGDVEGLEYFGLTRTRVGNFDAVVTRTGYTGDLGYEIWVER